LGGYNRRRGAPPLCAPRWVPRAKQSWPVKNEHWQTPSPPDGNCTSPARVLGCGSEVTWVSGSRPDPDSCRANRAEVNRGTPQPAGQRLSFTLFATAPVMPFTDFNSSTVARLMPPTEPNLPIKARFRLAPKPGIPSREETKARLRCTFR